MKKSMKDEGDKALKKSEGNNPTFSQYLFYTSILGAASEKEPWLLSYLSPAKGK